MIIDEYTNVFTNKMEFALHIVLDELTKIDSYAKGLPWEYIVLVKQTPNIDAVVQAVRLVEGMIKKRTADKTEVGEKKEE